MNFIIFYCGFDIIYLLNILFCYLSRASPQYLVPRTGFEPVTFRVLYCMVQICKKTESHSSLKMEPTRPCVFCTGDHWNDQCEKYRTAEERKQRSKWRCYICLLSGHRAFECVSNIQGKQKCYYCKRRNHHHRSLCQ